MRASTLQPRIPSVPVKAGATPGTPRSVPANLPDFFTAPPDPAPPDSMNVPGWSPSAPPIQPKDIPHADWTFFIHMNDDNNLEPDAVSNFEQAEKVGSLPGKVNVIALIGGKGEGLPDGSDWLGHSRLVYIEKGKAQQIAIDPASDLGKRMAESNGNLDMGDPGVLRAALAYVEANVPSDHVLVDVWDHGNGWRGVSYDDNSGGMISPVKGELNQALSGLKVDVLSDDACLEATDEIAQVAKAVGAQYLAASEEVEPNSGWNYQDVLSRMAKLAQQGPLTAGEMATAIADSYGAGPRDNSTMAAVDLSKLSAIQGALSAFTAELVKAGGLKNKAIGNAYQGTLRFDTPDQMDLGDFARRISQTSTGSLKTAADQMEQAIRSATHEVTAQGGQYAAAQGLSIYAPTSGGIDSTYTAQASPWHDEPWIGFLKTSPHANEAAVLPPPYPAGYRRA